MIKITLEIKNKIGLHMKPAGLLAGIAQRYSSHIVFKRDNNEYNAKSVLSILGSQTKYKDVVEFCFMGEDEQQACDEITELVNNGFGEE